MESNTEELTTEYERFNEIAEIETSLEEFNAQEDKTRSHSDWATTMKKIVWVCLVNGILWVWCSYILAALDKIQIAESLSQVAVTEIIGVVVAYAIKSLIENLSKNNNWPDKPGKDDPPGVG